MWWTARRFLEVRFEASELRLCDGRGVVRDRVNLLGTWVDCLDVPQAITQIEEFVQSGRSHQIITANVDFVRLARRNPAFRTLVNGADLVLADGMPLVWASRRSEQPLPCRVTGVDMLLACSQLAEV